MSKFKNFLNEQGNIRLIAIFAFALLFSLSFAPFLRAFLEPTLSAIVIAVIFVLSLVLGCILIGIVSKSYREATPPRNRINLKQSAILYAVFVLLWGIVFLVYYPGCASTDSNDIFKVILGYDFTSDWYRYDTVNNHHPAVYIFLNWCIIKGSMALGASTTIAVALVTIFHLLFLAWCCVHFCRKAYNITGSELLFLISLLFFLVNPLVILYSITIWKDILFSGIVLVIGIELFELSMDPESYLNIRSNLILLTIMLILCAILRSNGPLVAILAVVAAAFLFKHHWKTFAKIGVCVVMAYALVTGPVFSIVGVASGHFSEALSVPLQQVGLVISQDGEMSAEEAEYFNNVLPLNEYKEKYTPGSPNTIKFQPEFNDNFLESNKVSFFVNYLSLGLKHPTTYFKAWIQQTKSFWCIGSDTWYTIDAGYNIGTNGDVESKVSHNLLESVTDYSQVNKVLNIGIKYDNPLYNIGFIVWLMLFCIFVNLLGKRARYNLCLVPILIVWGTLLLAAPATDFRYVFSLHLSLPLMIMAIIYYRNRASDSSAKDNDIESKNRIKV